MIQECLDHQEITNQINNVYFIMQDIYSAINSSDLTCINMFVAMIIIYILSLETSFYAFVIREQQVDVTSFMSNLHSALTNVIAEQKHRTNFACVKMHALNSMLHALLEQVSANAATRIFETLNEENSGRNEATKYMMPCQNSASDVGCTAVLTTLSVRFLKTE